VAALSDILRVGAVAAWSAFDESTIMIARRWSGSSGRSDRGLWTGGGWNTARTPRLRVGAHWLLSSGPASERALRPCLRVRGSGRIATALTEAIAWGAAFPDAGSLFSTQTRHARQRRRYLRESALLRDARLALSLYFACKAQVGWRGAGGQSGAARDRGGGGFVALRGRDLMCSARALLWLPSD